MSDLVERLRELETLKTETGYFSVDIQLLKTCADTIESLQAKLEVAREAFEILTGERHCANNLMSNYDVAKKALALLSEEKP